MQHLTRSNLALQNSKGGLANKKIGTKKYSFLGDYHTLQNMVLFNIFQSGDSFVKWSENQEKTSYQTLLSNISANS